MMVVMIINLILTIIAIVDIAVLFKLIWAFKRLSFPTVSDAKDNELPTVTVCIAARNETHAMTQCLERVVTSDYPKIEVIVLDDGSRDDTSILIKSFANSGVRFIEGKELPDGWLGKNYAQYMLAQQASGKYILFLDVDTLIKKHTIMQIVSYALSKQARMVSVIPMRDDSWRTSLLFATMRHFWTVFRFNPTNPPAVANAWLIEREILLERFENESSLQHSMQVETTLARYLSKDKLFRLVASNTQLGLRYEKRWSSQVETSIRLLFPQRDRKLINVFMTAALLILGILPYIFVAFSLFAILPIVLQFIIALYYMSHMWGRYRFVGALLVPYSITQELILLLISTYKHKFGTITWKGRPITRK